MGKRRGLLAILAAAAVTAVAATTMLAIAAPQAVVGTIQWNRAWTNLNQTLTVTDADLDQNASLAEAATVKITSLSDPTGFTLTLAETGVNTGVFEATIQMTTASTDATNAGDSAASPRPRIKAADNDIIAAEYVDASEGNAKRTATVNVELTPPTISNLMPANETHTKSNTAKEVILTAEATDAQAGVKATTIKFFICVQSADCSPTGFFNEAKNSFDDADDDAVTGFGFNTSLYTITDITGGKRATVLVQLVDGDGTHGGRGRLPGEQRCALSSGVVLGAGEQRVPDRARDGGGRHAQGGGIGQQRQ